MWKVLEHRKLAKQLQSLPRHIVERYLLWRDRITKWGPSGLQDIRGFRDEALKGQWQGYRSSRLNNQYRVIYRVDAEDVKVFVVEVNAHEY